MTGYPKAIVEAGHVEPVPRRISATLGGQVVLQTVDALYLWEWPNYPQYLIPARDVDPAALTTAPDTQRLSRGLVATVGLRAGDTERPRAGRRYVESPMPELVDMIRFDWDALDAWYEEEEQVFVHPRSPYVRVDALRCAREVRVELEGSVLAHSTAPVAVIETGLPTRFYLDRGAVDFTQLVPSATVTRCPYTGTTSAYWSVRTGERIHPDLAWSYDFPTRELSPIAGMVAFLDEAVDVFLDGVAQERPVTHFSAA